MEFDILTLSIISTVITTVVEIVKAWVPQKYKTSDGIIIKRKNKKDIVIPNVAIWPTLSLVVGIIIFLVLKYTLFNDNVIDNTTASQAISGAASSLGSNGVYRVKTKLGGLLGASSSASAQNSGPASIDTVTSEVTSIVQECLGQTSTNESNKNENA